MDSHIDKATLAEIAQEKTKLVSEEWKHLDQCSECLDSLAEFIREIERQKGAQ